MSALAAPPRTKTAPLWIVGASGMLSGELLRLLDGHSGFTLAGAVSREPGRELSGVHRNLAGRLPATLSLEEARDDIAAALAATPAGPEAHGALVLGLPHASAAACWSELRASLGDVAERLLVVDLSADYRLRDAAEYARWYGGDHADTDELGRFAYGLPELFRASLVGATRVAAPGCFATALQLAAWPAAKTHLADPESAWVFHAVTGSSGSGAEPKPATHHPYRHGNMWAYALGGHRHEAELGQTLANLGLAPPIAFLPCSGPFARGIHLTAALPLAADVGTEDARAVYRETYAGEPFVEVLEDGVPDLRSVVGSNRALLAVHVREKTLVVLLALDNLIKGGAGQALQSLNLMLGYPEGQGLPRCGLGVV